MHNECPGDYIITRRRATVWQAVVSIAGGTLILIGVAATWAFAYTAVLLVFSLGPKP